MAGGTTNSNPYVAGDMHNHNTCTDGSVAVAYAIDRSVGTGTDAAGGANFNLDWFTLGNHGGSGNRDCRFSDTSAQIPGQATQYWANTLGQTIDGITITKLLGTQPSTPTSMWRWQNIIQVEYPYIVNRSQQYKKVLIEGLEWIVPGHEHTDVAIINHQMPLLGKGDANPMAEFEYRFDRADSDAIGLLRPNGKQMWTGKDTINVNGTAGHGKAVAGATWLQANYPVTSYLIPTHSERQGPFSLTSSKGYNIEHFRDFNNAAPTVAFGIESPGHAAQGGVSGGAGSYGSTAVGGGTYGFVGVYNAKVGGLWDGLLGEGRNMWMFVSSDWHNRGAFGARDAATTGDFIPGEYSKLYVLNRKSFVSASVISGMRSGNSYSVAGDLIGSDLRFVASACNTVNQCSGPVTMGQTLTANPGDVVTVTMSFTVPASNYSPYSFNNPLLAQNGISQPLNAPSLDHIDLITGDVTGPIAPTASNYAVANAGGTAGAAIVYNTSAKIAKQIAASTMQVATNGDGSKKYTFHSTFTMGSTPWYVRARGTNMPVATPNVTDSAGNPLLDVTNSLVPCTDAACPAHLDTVNGQKMVTHDVQAWSNLWFYANPIFVRNPSTPKLLAEVNADMAMALGGR